MPVAAVLGGNASGKSNFVKALQFARDLIVDGVNGKGAKPVEPYLLQEVNGSRPTNIKFKLLIDSCVYEYKFAVTNESVDSESLTEVDNNKTIFAVKDSNMITDLAEEEKEKFKLVFDLKKSNQLFLTTINQLTNYEMPIYEWFKNNLSFILPETEINTSYYESENILLTANKLLKRLGCGADQIGFLNYNPSENELAYLESELKEKKVAFIRKKQVFAKKLAEEIVTERLVTFHKSEDSDSVMFDLKQESDGTARIFDLLPAFLGLTQSGKNHVVVIEEIERSLHTHLVQSLIRAYLDNCNADSMSQLIFTTHNVQLLNKDLLRTDEMWLTKRELSGASKLYSIDEFKDVEKVRNIRESYLTGQFGGIPDFLLLESQLKLDSDTA